MTHAPENVALAGAPDSSPIAALLQPFVDRGTLAGAVTLVATLDQILSLDAVGFADLAARRPLKTDDLFWIASMTKPMTAAALMMLVDEGHVSVDEPVETYLPEFKGQLFVARKDDEQVVLKKPQHPILVREILCHTSGMTPLSPIETPTLDRLLLEHAVRSHAMSPLQFEPGTQYQYCNAGTNTAGRIIEVVSGLRYEDFMQERFFTPLGMRDTTFWPDEKQIERLAKIYASNADRTGLEEARLTQLAYPLNDPARRSMPAGGLFSTATDVLEFCRMILAGGDYRGRHYLSAAAIAQMTSKQTGPAIAMEYGFCWSTDNNRWYHGGAYKTNMTIHPSLGLITVFLVHQANNWPQADGDTIHPLFLDAATALAAASEP